MFTSHSERYYGTRTLRHSNCYFVEFAITAHFRVAFSLLSKPRPSTKMNVLSHAKENLYPYELFYNFFRKFTRERNCTLQNTALLYLIATMHISRSSFCLYIA